MIQDSKNYSTVVHSPKVYVTQDTDLDLAKATVYGELVPLLPRKKNITLSPQPVIRELRQKLRNFTDADYLLLIGDPVAIILAGMVTAEMNNGRIRTLKWDRLINNYYPVTIDFYDRGVK